MDDHKLYQVTLNVVLYHDNSALILVISSIFSNGSSLFSDNENNIPTKMKYKRKKKNVINQVDKIIKI